MSQHVVVRVEGHRHAPKVGVSGLVADLFPPAEAEATSEQLGVSCEAAATRLSRLGCFRNVSVLLVPGDRQQEVAVVVKEPKHRWTLGLNTTASPGAVGGLSSSVAVSLGGSVRHPLGSMGSVEAHVGYGGKETDAVGEVCYSRALFPTGGWSRVVATGNAVAAAGDPVLATVGVRMARDDRRALSGTLQKIKSLFCSLRGGRVGNLGLEISSHELLAVPGRSNLRLGRASSPRLLVSHTAVADGFGGEGGYAQDDRFGFGASLTHEIAVGQPAQFVRQTGMAEARLPIWRGITLKFVGRLGSLMGFGADDKQPSEDDLSLEGFTVGGDLVRCVSMKPRPVAGSNRSGIASFASLSTMLSVPVPKVPPVGSRRVRAHLWLDAGVVSQSWSVLKAAKLALRRVSTGFGFSIPIGEGRVELNFGLPLVKSQLDGHHRFDLNVACPFF